MHSEITLDITTLDVAQRRKSQDIATNNYEILNPKSSEVVVIASTRAAATGANEVVEAE